MAVGGGWIVFCFCLQVPEVGCLGVMAAVLLVEGHRVVEGAAVELRSWVVERGA